MTAVTPDSFDSPDGRTYSEPESAAVTPGQAARDMDIAFAVVAADRNTLREVLRRIALGQERDPSVAADKALVESRKRGDAIAARQPQPAPGRARVPAADGWHDMEPQPAPELAAAKPQLTDVTDFPVALRPELGTAWRLLNEARADRDDYAARLRAADESWARVAAERDKAYRERTALVAFLAACYPAEIVEQPGKFADEWPVIYIDTPAGQLSWHLARNDLGLFAHVRGYIDGRSPWDGHTTEQKYERLARLIPHAPGMRHEAGRPALADELEAEASRLSPPGAPEDQADMAGYIRAEALRAAAGIIRERAGGTS